MYKSSVNQEGKGPYTDSQSKLTSTSVLYRSVGASATPAGSGTNFKSWEASTSSKVTPTSRMDSKCGGGDGGASGRSGPKDKEKNQNIQVFVRVRPINAQETAKCTTEIIDTPGNREVVVKERSVANVTKTFTFDRVFGQKSKQMDVYKHVVSPLLQEVLLGYNCTVFAYGQTGTGKTFTMEGERKSNFGVENDPHAGMLPRALSQLFDEVRMMNCEFSVRASFLELYNEELFDLLAPIEDNKAKTLRLFEDTSRKGSVIIQGLEEVIVNNKQEVYAVLDRGSQQRKTAATLMNATSSRSHTIFTITVHMKESSVDGEEMVKVGKLNLVDLAGSENIGKSGAVDKRAREAGNINQSLLTLGRVISALVERAPHVPYRESKLTRLLQDSLGGKTKTSFIATISPAALHIEETLSTLDYAHRAKNIMNRPEVNQRISKKEAITMYTDEIERLRKDLTAAREKNGIYIDSDNYHHMLAQIQSQVCELNEKSNKIRDLEETVQNKEDEMQEAALEISDLKLDIKTKQTIMESLQAQKKKLDDKLYYCYKKIDENKHLIKYHEGTEAKMSSEANALLDTANDTVSIIEQLHGRLERKQLVEQTNWKNAGRFREDFRKAVDDIIDGVQDVKQRHTIGISVLREILGNRSTDRREAFEDYSAKFNYATGKIETVQTTMAELSKSFVELAKIKNDTMTSLVEQTNISAHSTMADNVKNVYGLMDILKKELSGIKDVLGTLHNELPTKFDKINNVVMEALKGNVHRFTQTEKALVDLRDLWSRVFKEVNESCLDTSKSVCTFREDFNKRLDKFTKELASLKEDADANFSAVASSTLFIETTMSSGGKQIEQRLANEGNNIKEKRMQTEGVLKKREQFRNDMVITPQTSLVRLQDRLANNEKTMTGTQKQVEDMQMFVSKTLTSVTATVSDVGEATISELRSVDEKLTELMDSQLVSMVKLKEQSNKSVKEITEGEDKSTSKLVEHVDRQCDLVSTACTEISSGLAHTSGSVDEFFEETYLTDGRTGGTPMRRKFDFPTSLSLPSPQARVLARYRGLHSDAFSNISEASDSSDLNSSVGTVTDDHEKLSQPMRVDMLSLTLDDIDVDIENEDPKPIRKGSKDQEKMTPRDFPAEGTSNAAQEEKIPSTPSSQKSEDSVKSQSQAGAKGGKNNKKNKRKSGGGGGGNKGVLRAPN